MSITIPQTKGTIISTGEYTGKVVEITEEDGKFGQQLRVKFALSGPPDIEGVTLSAWYSKTFSPKSRLWSLVSACFGGVEIPANYNLSTDDLISRKLRLVVVEKAGKEPGYMFSKVDSVKPLKPATISVAAPPAPVPPPVPAASPDDNSQIPF